MENNEFENQAAGSPDAASSKPHSGAPDYLTAAKAACAAGDGILGIHLYMAAYETEMANSAQPSPAALSALHAAWDLAISLKERSMAEYVFEKIEPYLSAREMGEFADALQRLAIDRLEQFGISREELEDMANSLSDDFFGGPLGEPSIHIEQFTIPAAPRSFVGDQSGAGLDAVDSSGAAALHHAEIVGTAETAPGEALPCAAGVQDAIEGRNTSSQGADAASEGIDTAVNGADAAPQAPETPPDANASQPGSASARANTALQPGAADAQAALGRQPQAPSVGEKYDDLIGFDSAIEDMRSIGIGIKDDPEFDAFVERLNALYGIDRARAVDTLLFSCKAREDANRFLEATSRELDLPVIRMSLEESVQGNAMLVISSEGIDMRGRQNFMRFGFTRPAILVISDIDAWPLSDFDAPDDRDASPMQVGAARGMRDAMNLIRSAVSNSEVYVLASAASVDDVEPALIDAIYPATVVGIELPTESERRAIWEHLTKKHPTLSRISVEDLVRLSEGMPRYDMSCAAREAIEEAYRRSLVTRSYQPVTAQNIFEKIAAYQPLESKQYEELESKVIEDFRRDLMHLDDILNEGN